MRQPGDEIPEDIFRDDFIEDMMEEVYDEDEYHYLDYDQFEPSVEYPLNDNPRDFEVVDDFEIEEE